MRIRPAQLDELEELAWIEHEADGLFGLVGVDVILDAPAPPTADYAKAQEAGRILVAELPTGRWQGSSGLRSSTKRLTWSRSVSCPSMPDMGSAEP